MSCQRCSSERIAEVGAKSSDSNNIGIGEKEHNGYVPDDLGIGGGDYIEFNFCLDCGQIQGKFPLPSTKIEQGTEE